MVEEGNSTRILRCCIFRISNAVVDLFLLAGRGSDEISPEQAVALDVEPCQPSSD